MTMIWLNSVCLKKGTSCLQSRRKFVVFVSFLACLVLILGYVFQSSAVNIEHQSFYCRYCNHFKFTYIIENEGACVDRSDVFLLILVFTSHQNVQRRDVIRRTWASQTPHIKTLFVLGTKPAYRYNVDIAKEQRQHGDIIQARFVDEYQTLTQKSAMALTWATKNCPAARFLLKTDDDCLIMPTNMLSYLQQVDIDADVDRFIGGRCFSTSVHRGRSKYAVPEDIYPHSQFPVFCSGPGYVMSMSAVRDIVDVMNDTKYVPLEDVFITGLCRLQANIQYSNIPWMSVSEDHLTVCDLAHSIISVHDISPQRMERIWTELHRLTDTTSDCIQIDHDICALYSLGFLLSLVMFASFWLLTTRRHTLTRTCDSYSLKSFGCHAQIDLEA